MDISTLEVPEGAVIIVRDSERSYDDDKAWDWFLETIWAQHPKSMVLLLSGDTTFETMSTDELQVLLEDLIAHRAASA